MLFYSFFIMLKWLDCINFWLDWILLQMASHTSLLRRLHCPLENERENGERTDRDSVPAKYRQGDDLLRKLARAYKSNLNPWTIHADGCGEGAWWNRGGRKQASKVTMTTLWAAPTRHHHTENLSGKRRRYLARKTSRQEGGLGAKHN